MTPTPPQKKFSSYHKNFFFGHCGVNGVYLIWIRLVNYYILLVKYCNKLLTLTFPADTPSGFMDSVIRAPFWQFLLVFIILPPRQNGVWLLAAHTPEAQRKALLASNSNAPVVVVGTALASSGLHHNAQVPLALASAFSGSQMKSIINPWTLAPLVSSIVPVIECVTPTEGVLVTLWILFLCIFFTSSF